MKLKNSPVYEWVNIAHSLIFIQFCYSKLEGVSYCLRKMYLNAVFQKIDNWYVAWVEEIPGVNTQGRTLKEARENLREALGLVVEANRDIAKQLKSRQKEECIREQISVR